MPEKIYPACFNAGYESKLVAEVDVTLNQDNYIEIVLSENAKSNLEGVVLKTTTRHRKIPQPFLVFNAATPHYPAGWLPILSAALQIVIPVKY